MPKLRRTKCPRCKKDVAVRRGGEIREHRGNKLGLQVAAKTFSSERDQQAWLDKIDDKYTEILDDHKPTFVLDSTSCEVNPCDD